MALVHEGTPMDAYLQEMQAGEEAIEQLVSPALKPVTLAAQGWQRSESHSLAPNTAWQAIQTMFASTPVELSFIVTTSLEQPPTMPSAFSEKLKYAICSSVLLAEPSASLLHDAPSSMRRGRDGTEIKTLLAIVAALVAFQIAWWPLLPVALAIAWALHWRETREGAVTKPQRRLLDRLEDLLASAQHFDSILHRSTTLVREVECVSRGLGLSHPLPPVSRLETAHFDAPPSTPPLVNGHPLPSLEPSPSIPALRAPALRRALQTSLQQMREACLVACFLFQRPLADGADNADLRTLYETYNLLQTSEPLASFALQSRRNSRYSAGGAGRNTLRDSLRSSVGSRNGKRLSATYSLPPTSPTNANLASPTSSISAALERRSSRSSNRSRSNRSSMVLPVKPVMAANEVDLQGVDHGPDHEDLSLVGIEAAFETMHADRQRVLCHLLAIDFGADVALEEVEAAIITLNGQFLSGTTSLSAAARSEFGDDCLDLPSLPSSEADVRIVGAYEHGQPIGTTMPRDKPSTETLRSFSFAPPLPPNHQQRTHLSAFATRSAAMQTSLRSIAAKLHLTSSDLSSSSITEQERIIAMHDSIRGDLEALMREWDQSRVSLRSAFAPSSKKKKPAPPMRRDTITQASPRSALELTDDEEEEEEEEGASSELFTPDEDAGDNSILEQDEVEEEAGERVFEAIGGTMERSKLSREERIALVRLKREASPVPMGSRDGMMVDELKGVLRELKERRPRVV